MKTLTHTYTQYATKKEKEKKKEEEVVLFPIENHHISIC
jgi:hypothetical protein